MRTRATTRGHDITATFVRWLGLRGLLNRGYVLTSGLYFVITGHLSASQLVWLGTGMSLALLFADIPAGVLADSISRKWTLVIGQLLLATAMVLTGLVTTFSLLVLSQVVWGLGWAFLNGADVAWLNDELNDPHRIARVLTASARWGVAGRAVGMLTFGLLGWATNLATAIIVAGVAMALLAIFVAVRFTERNFTPKRVQRWETALEIFRRGISLARRDQEILLVFVATLALNSATMVAWLFPRQLINLGFPSNPILWYTAIGILSAALGVMALSIVEARIDGVGVARRYYAFACLIGVLGLVALAVAPVALIGGVGVLLLNGITDSVTRPISVVWVNRRTTSDVRATVHSFLSQAESMGEICGGFLLAALAQVRGISVTLLAAGAVLALTGIVVAWSRADRASMPLMNGRG
ncbi:MAG TPA: MFS transporter [Ktedonobacterales bacterium]|nr:MFS transporter [Ktedonobacterales bacterium]